MVMFWGLWQPLAVGSAERCTGVAPRYHCWQHRQQLPARVGELWQIGPTSSSGMPKHDIQDGNQADANLVDFRDYLRRRVDLARHDRSEPESEASDWEMYRHAEHADGKRPRFGRHDLIWVAMILAIGWIIWVVATSRA